MKKEFIEKVKNIFLFILKSTILIFLCRKLIPLSLILATKIIAIIENIYKLFNIQTIPKKEAVFLLVLIIIFFQTFQVIVRYFISKKLGIIEYFNKLPLFFSLIIVIVYDNFIMQTPLEKYQIPYSSIQDLEFTLVFLMLTSPYLYTFIYYKTMKFLVKRFPEKFEKLRKFL